MVMKGGCHGWFRQRTNLEKTLLSLSCILTLTLLLLILIGVTFHGNSDDSALEKEYECFSSECISTAGQILSTMNEKTDPCSNFYEYACGNYGKTPGETNSVAQSSVDSVHLSIKNMLESNTSSKVENIDAVKSLFSSCMAFDELDQLGVYDSKGSGSLKILYSGSPSDNHLTDSDVYIRSDGLHKVRKDSAQVLLDIMKSNGLGSWPVLESMYEYSTLPISDRLASLAMLGVPVAFQVDVIPDPHIKGSYILKLSPGGPLEVGRLAIEIIKDDDLRTYMLFSFFLIGIPNYLRATNLVDEILSVDASYAKIDQDPFNRMCDSVDTLTPEESLSKLNTIIPEMNWTSLVSMMQKEAGLQRPFAVEVHCKSKIRDYLVHLHDILDNTLDNYLGWRFFESFSKHISPAFRRRRSSSRRQPPPRWKECVELLEKYAPTPLMQGLTLEEHQEGKEEQIQHLSTSTQAAAEHLVSQIGWLDQNQKTNTLRQVRQTKVHLPYLKKTDTSRSVELPHVNKDEYTSAVIVLRRQSIIRKFKSLNPLTDLEELEEDFPLTSESSVSTASSALEIYFDKLREPYFREHGSDWLNMGGLGTFLSREFVQDILSVDVGSSVDNYHSVWDTWKNRSAAGCLLNLFSKNLGLSTRNENNAILKELFLDASSLEMALESSKTGAKFRRSFLPGLKTKSDEQLFFIAYAQTLCQANGPTLNSTEIPMKHRVNTILANSQEFENAFSCSSSASQPKCPVFI